MDTAGEAWPVAYLGHGQEKACLKEIWNRPENGLFVEKLEPAGKCIVEKNFGTGWKTDYFGHGWFLASFIPFHNATVLCFYAHIRI